MLNTNKSKKYKEVQIMFYRIRHEKYLPIIFYFQKYISTFFRLLSISFLNMRKKNVWNHIYFAIFKGKKNVRASISLTIGFLNTKGEMKFISYHQFWVYYNRNSALLVYSQ